MTGIHAIQAIEEYTIHAGTDGGSHPPGGTPTVTTGAGRKVAIRKGDTLIVRSVKVRADGVVVLDLITTDHLQQIAAGLLAD
jgi:hypothetical protein